MNRLPALVLCAAGLACTPSPPQSAYGNVTGSVEDQTGNSFQFGSAAEGDTIQVSGPNCAGTAQQSTLILALSSLAGFCTGSQGNIAIPSNEAIVMSLVGSPAQSGGAAPTIAPGVYPIGSGVTDAAGNTYVVSATFLIFDATCNQEDLVATSGNIELDSLSGGEAIGEFSLDFFGDANNSLSGSFDTVTCPFTQAQLCATSGVATCGS